MLFKIMINITNNRSFSLFFFTNMYKFYKFFILGGPYPYLVKYHRFCLYEHY